MSDSVKGTIDKILYAAAVTLVVVFVMGMIFDVSAMARGSLWVLMFVGAGLSGMVTYEYLWRNTVKAKETMLLVQMIATVAITLLVIAFAIFALNGKLINLPAKPL